MMFVETIGEPSTDREVKPYDIHVGRTHPITIARFDAT